MATGRGEYQRMPDCVVSAETCCLSNARQTITRNEARYVAHRNRRSKKWVNLSRKIQ